MHQALFIEMNRKHKYHKYFLLCTSVVGREMFLMLFAHQVEVEYLILLVICPN